MQYVMGLKNKCAKGLANIRKGVSTQSSPFHDIETELYKEFVSRIKSSQKVSATWIRINREKIYETLKIQSITMGRYQVHWFLCMDAPDHKEKECKIM